MYEILCKRFNNKIQNAGLYFAFSLYKAFKHQVRQRITQTIEFKINDSD